MPTVALQSLFILCFISVSSCQDVHMGDIKLMPCQNDTNCKTTTQVIGTFMIYYGSDKEVPRWRPICNDRIHDYNWKTSNAICNMLGYASGQPLPPDKIKRMKLIMPIDYMYALTQLDCTEPMSNGGSPSHLLRCSYQLYTHNEVCGRPIILKCTMPKGQPLILRNFISYNGQVQLCPPDEVIDDSTYPARQVSFGIVSTYLHSFWGSLNENSSSMVGYDQTNNICKQLGFTGAVRDSARTVSSYKGQYSFINCHGDKSGLQRAWLTVSQTSRCNSNPCSCFSCCYEQPEDGHQCSVAELQTDGQCPKGHCCTENDVVIECTFDKMSSSPPLSGTKDVCAFENGQKLLSFSSTGCTSSGVQYSQKQFLAGLLVPTVAFVFVLGVLLLYMFVSRYYHKKRRQDYQQLQGVNEGGGGAREEGN